MEVQTYYPRNPLLGRYIEYYYFLKTTDPDFKSVYYAFPNILHSFNIHHYASCEITPEATKVYGDVSNKYLMVLQGRYELPLMVDLRGVLDKITIIFKPIGLAPFITRSFMDIGGQPSQIFKEWEGDVNCSLFLDAFYGTANENERIDILENYLLSRYQPVPEENIINRAIEMLTDFDNEHSIKEVAEHISMNVRSFHRLFHKNLGIPPVAFRKVARFRHSLKNKLFSDRFKTLTEIGYASNFSDQSYFIKMYKKLTGDNPNNLFRSIEKLGNDHLIFKFIKE